MNFLIDCFGGMVFEHPIMETKAVRDPYLHECLKVPSAPNKVWSIDFVMGALANGRPIKCLTIVDDFTKEAVDIFVDYDISDLYVVRALDRAVRFRGYPRVLRTDNGLEFASRDLYQWLAVRDVTMECIPTSKAYIESFNRIFLQKCLNEHRPGTLAHARAVIEEWRQGYNETRPHGSHSSRIALPRQN
jgi:putative transposase